MLAGKIVSKTGHFALHRTPLVTHFEDDAGLAQSMPMFSTEDVWIGAMVPKRWAKRAVTRNTIRRQIYCVGESFGDRLLPQAHVVRLRKGFDRAIFTSATSEVLKQAVRAEIESLFSSALGIAATER